MLPGNPSLATTAMSLHLVKRLNTSCSSYWETRSELSTHVDFSFHGNFLSNSLLSFLPNPSVYKGTPETLLNPDIAVQLLLPAKLPLSLAPRHGGLTLQCGPSSRDSQMREIFQSKFRGRRGNAFCHNCVTVGKAQWLSMLYHLWNLSLNPSTGFCHACFGTPI